MALNLGKLSILVVEDTKPMKDLIEAVLDSLGVGRIYTSDNGQTGLELVKRYNPDIILVDWEMSEFDGLMFTREIRRNRTYPNIMVPIIMVTGYGMVSRVAQARDAGVTEFIVKPFTANDLTKRIKYVINQPRDFIESANYVGPDRRRRQDSQYKGPFRREDDNAEIGQDNPKTRS